MSAARRLGAAVVLAVAAASAYRLGLRDRCLSWGATDEEVDRTMAGDELMPDPDVVATRAVDDRRAAERRLAVARADGQRPRRRVHLRLDREPVRPWHAQRRPSPAGVPGYRRRRRVRAGARAARSMRVEVLEPERALAFRFEDGTWVWSFAPLPAGRVDAAGQPQPDRHPRRLAPGARLVSQLLMEPGSLVMERKMLLGIKERSERLAREMRGDRWDSNPRPPGPQPGATTS